MLPSRCVARRLVPRLPVGEGGDDGPRDLGRRPQLCRRHQRARVRGRVELHRHRGIARHALDAKQLTLANLI